MLDIDHAGADLETLVGVDSAHQRGTESRRPALLKKVVQHGAVYAAINAFGILVGVFILPIYARVLPPEAFGAQDLVVLLATLVTLTAPLEVTQGLARQYAEITTRQQQKVFASTALWFTLIAEATAAIALLLLRSWLAPWILGPWNEGTWWLLVAAFVAAHGLYTLLLSQLRWRLQPLRYAATVLVQIVTVYTLGIGLVALGWGLPGLLVGYAAGHALAASVAFMFGRDDYRLVVDRPALRRMLTFSVPLVPSSMAVILYSYGDRLVIRQWLDLEAVGHYAMLARFAFLVKPLIMAASMALTPLVVTRHRDPHTPLDVARFCRYLWLGVLACVLLLAALGPELMSILVTARYAEDARLLPLLASAFALAELYIVAPGLFIAQRTRTIAAVNIGSAVVNLVLNMFLVPIAGLLGACIGTAVSAVGALSLNIRLGQRYYPIPYPWRALAGTGAVSLVASATAIAFASASPLWDVTSLVVRASLALSGFVVSAVWLLGPDLNIRTVLAVVADRLPLSRSS